MTETVLWIVSPFQDETVEGAPVLSLLLVPARVVRLELCVVLSLSNCSIFQQSLATHSKGRQALTNYNVTKEISAIN